MFCTQCGWNNDSKNHFCSKCGKTLVRLEAEADAFAGNTPQGVPQSSVQRHITQQPAAAAQQPAVAAAAPQQGETTPDKKRAAHGWKYLVVGIGATAIALVAVFALLNVLGVIQFAPKHETFEGAGYSKPEEAAAAYVEAIKSMDVRRVWSTFAIESYVENYDFVYNVERLNAYTPASPQLAPPSNEFSYSTNLFKRLYDAAPPYSALWAYELVGGSVVYFPSGYTEGDGIVPDGLSHNQFAGYLEDYTYEKLRQIQDMEITEIVLPDNFSRYARKYGLEDVYELYSGENNAENIDRSRLVYGADEMIDVIIFLSIDNEEYVMIPSLVRYGDRWWVLSRSGNLGVFLNFSPYQYMAYIGG